LIDGGLLILDDVFNPHWPGVASGLAESISRDDFGLTPIAVLPGKMVFCDREHVSVYSSWLASEYAGWVDYTRAAFGGTVMGIGVDGYSHVRAFKNSPFGMALKAVLRKHRQAA